MKEPEPFPVRDDGPGQRRGPVSRPRHSTLPEVVEPGRRAPEPGGSTAAGAGYAEIAGADDGEAAYVRPYTVTGGRTRPSGTDLPFEALVEALAEPRPGHCPESRRILGLAAGQYLSVAELSAHLGLAVGAVRVLVGDLADEGAVRVHGLTATTSQPSPATNLSVLESVLNGISAL